MSEHSGDMSKGGIEARIRKLRDDLEDLEDTFNFNLTNTSAHLRSGVVAEHEDEIRELQKEIKALESRLKDI